MVGNSRINPIWIIIRAEKICQKLFSHVQPIQLGFLRGTETLQFERKLGYKCNEMWSKKP